MVQESSQFNNAGIIAKVQNGASRESFVPLMQGVYSLSITLHTFAFGEVNITETPNIYRRYYYDNKGQVIKKLFFDSDGNITNKEEYFFDSVGKIVGGRFITDEYINNDEYEYDEKGLLKEYRFFDPRWPRPKVEKYEADKMGRVLKKTSFGLMGIEELVTEYLYDGNSKKYSFRKMTDSNGKLIMTFYNTYTDKGKYAGLYGFLMEPDEVLNLIKESKKLTDWEMKSEFRSKWEYNTAGNMTGFLKDEKIPKNQKLDFGLINLKYIDRLPVQKSTYEYSRISGKERLVKIIEWLPRFDEPIKELKEYSYEDKSPAVLNPLLAK